jgi:hypothetical protein
MRLRFARNTEADNHKRRTLLKRLGIIAGFAFLLLLAATTIVLRHKLMVQIGDQNWVAHTRLLYMIRETAEHAAIASAIISLGRSLNLRVIAEEAETLEDIDFLKSRECDEAQDFFFGRPVPAAEFAKLLVEHTPRLDETPCPA